MCTLTTKVAPRRSLERRIVQSYVWVLRAPKTIDGLQTASLARHGAYEVRLIEPSGLPNGDSMPFWIELFDHKHKFGLDSCGGDDLEKAAVAAEDMIAEAERRHRGAIPS